MKWWNWRERESLWYQERHMPVQLSGIICDDGPANLLRVLWILIWMRGPKETRMSAGHTAVLSNKHENLRSRICQMPQGIEWNWQIESRWVQTTEAIHRKRLFWKVFWDKSCLTTSCACPSRSHKEMLVISETPGILCATVQMIEEGFLVYNVHQMLHITNVAIQFERLDECRAFAFKNFNEKLKRMVCCGRNPLAQIIRRIV